MKRSRAAFADIVGRSQEWLWDGTTQRATPWLRALLIALLIARCSRTLYPQLAAQVPELFRPEGVLQLAPHIPSRPVMFGLQVIVAVAGILAILTPSRVALPLAWVAALVLNSAATSVGKIVHNDVLLMLCLMPFLLFRPTARSDPAPTWPIRAAALIVAMSYFFTGLQKLVHSGPAWAFSDNLLWILTISSDTSPMPNAIALWIADHAWLSQVLATGSLALELSLPVVLVRPRLVPVACLAILGLHAGIWATMGLDYFGHAATAILVLLAYMRTHTPRGAITEPALGPS